MQRVLVYLYPASINTDILYNLGAFVKTKNWYNTITKLQTLFRFCSVPTSNSGYHIAFSCHGLFSLFPSVSYPFFWPWHFWKVLLAILSIVNLGLSDVFLWLGWAYGFGGRIEVKCLLITFSQHVLVLVILTLFTWFKGWLPDFFIEELLIFRRSELAPKSSPYSRGRELSCTFCWEEYLTIFGDVWKNTPVINILNTIRLYFNYLFNYCSLLLDWMLIELRG